MNINLVREKKTGKSKGFCFLCYENQKSTVLAVDNLNGIKVCSSNFCACVVFTFILFIQLCGRVIRVDHVNEYRRPKDEDGNEIIEKGCAPKTPTPSPQPSESESEEPEKVKKKKKTKDKKKKKQKDKISSPSYMPVEYSKTKKQSRIEDSTPDISRKASKSSKQLDGDYMDDKSGHLQLERTKESKDRDSYKHREERRHRDSYRQAERKRYRDRSRSHSRDRK